MKQGVGPDIWLAGDPSDLQKYMNNGTKGIVTNTVVQKELVQKYGSLTNLTKEYLNITDKKIAIEIDGNSTQELLEVGEKFTELSDQIILKIPCSQIALEAFSVLKKEGVETRNKFMKSIEYFGKGSVYIITQKQFMIYLFMI